MGGAGKGTAGKHYYKMCTTQQTNLTSGTSGIFRFGTGSAMTEVRGEVEKAERAGGEIGRTTVQVEE